MEKGILKRIFISVFLLAILIVLFILQESEKNKQLHQQDRLEISDRSEDIDSAIENVLLKFDIEKNWIKRIEITLPGIHEKRIERRVQIPPEIIPAIVNLELKRAAKEFNMSVSATENLKDNSVSIHIHDQNKIIHTIILKVNKSLKRKENSYQLKKS